MSYPNWFAPYAQGLFEKHLTPLAGQPGLKFLQIGAFTGDASVWLLDNVLTGKGSILYDVDTWRGSDEPEHDQFDWGDVEATYLERTKFYPDHRLQSFPWTSEDFFDEHVPWYFDFIYIDGDHTPRGVLEDGVAAFKCLKPGGLIAFDDYLWTDSRTGVGPKIAVDAIEACYRGHLQLIQSGAQAWFRKAVA